MAHHSRLPHWAGKVYETLLLAYPREHRAEYGALMKQLFRDQWRDAAGSDMGRVPVRFALATLADVIRSAFCEHVIQQTETMKNISWKKLSLLLFAIAIVAGMFSCTTSLRDQNLALGLAYLSALVLAARAVVEWKRPSTELLSSLVTGAIIAVVYALIMPVWAKTHLPVVPGVIVIPLLNALIPVSRAGLRLIGRQS
jgi:hypothetical protein